MGVYRVEVSPNNRAGCQVKACKDAGIKITKGELRFAVQVTIKEHVSWQYRHWGCVTPKQIENLNETCEGDTDMIDGYDELPEEFQEKIKFALEHNHIPDEDCTREPELNRLGIKKPRAKKAKKDEVDEASEDEKPKKGAKKAVKEEDEEDEAAPAPKNRGRKPKLKTEDEDEAGPAPKKRGRPSKKQVEEDDGEEDSAPPAKKTRTNGKSKKTSGPTNESEEEAPPPKKARSRKPVAKQAEPEDGSEAEEDTKPKKAPQKRGRKKASE